MTWDEMDSLERSRQFKIILRRVREAVEREAANHADAQEVETGPFPNLIDESKFRFGYGRPMQIISDGEWMLIKSLKAGGKNE